MSAIDRFVRWFRERFGIDSVDSVLRPIPSFSFRPDYWMGALLVLAFVMQGITGFLLLLYYVPTPDQAWASTNAIVTGVPYGSLLLTFHLYDAYAIILITFLHMFRNFFVGAYKRPRESMWFYGVILGLITLGFGFTGYLLPWTVVSKSATDVGIGMLNYFPSWLTGPIKSILIGNGTDASELTRFFAMHVILLPLLLALFIFLKLFTFEAHGISPPPGQKEGEAKAVSWMPSGILYLLMIGLFYVGGLLIISSLFPYTLPPAYSVQAAMSVTPEPDWYFLWIYQVLKLSIFGGQNVIYALLLITLLFVVLFFVPIIDMRGGRRPSERPVVFTLGMIVATSVVFLTIWAYFTPGVTIPFYQAVLYIGGIAVVEGLAALLALRRRKGGASAGGVHPSVAMAALVASIAGASASLLMLEKGYLIGLLLMAGFIYASLATLSKAEKVRRGS